MITTATAYPSRYADEPMPWEREELEAAWKAWWAMEAPGRFYLRFDVLHEDERKNRHLYTAPKQRTLATLLGKALGEKPIYQRGDRLYRIGGGTCASGWTVSNGDCVHTGLFDGTAGGTDMTRVLDVLSTLRAAGLKPDGEITVYFHPERYDAQLIMNLCVILEARRTMLTETLGLQDELQIIVDEELALGIPLSAFSVEKVEACICLLGQACRMAASTHKVRMQPCDMRNPKYQMRTWLLRLGFVGEAFARARHTLLEGLDGNGAFFTEDGKEKAAVKRRAAKLVG